MYDTAYDYSPSVTYDSVPIQETYVSAPVATYVQQPAPVATYVQQAPVASFVQQSFDSAPQANVYDSGFVSSHVPANAGPIVSFDNVDSYGAPQGALLG